MPLETVESTRVISVDADKSTLVGVEVDVSGIIVPETLFLLVHGYEAMEILQIRWNVDLERSDALLEISNVVGS